MGLDDLVNKGKELFEDNKEKIEGLLKSEEAEGVSDNVLDGASDLANKVTGGKFEEQIDGARNAADEQVGNE